MALLAVVFYAFVIIVLIQMVFYVFLFKKFSFSEERKKPSKNIPVSVIICVKNEAENLKNFLPYIIEQDYSNFEIVLINDASNDKTLKVMKHFEKLHDNIKVVDVKPIEAFWGNKKYAITLGIKASKNDYLLFTNATCKPLTKRWIKEMTSHFNSKKTIVLGFGAYSKVNKSFLNKLIRFDALVTAVQYFSFAKIGMPYMGVGRNLAYTKKEFFNSNGFIEHIKLRSGDDDLFVNQIANHKNTAICLSKESFTESVPKTTFNEWIKQKKWCVLTAKYYKQKHKLLLSLIFTSHVLFWFLGFILLAFGFNWQIVISLLLLRFTLQYIVYGASAKKLESADLIGYVPVLELFLITTQLTIFINNMFSKPKHWK